MNIWDSVQRGLEKASQEAARIARTQRLRATLDGLFRQIDTQRGQLLSKTMELWSTGQLTQKELLSICQDLHTLQLQFTQVQNELRIVQSQSNQGTTSNANTVFVPPAQQSPTGYAPPPPDYQPYEPSTLSFVPPPPPGVEPNTVSSPPSVEQTHCVVCQAILVPGNAFCHNCGTPIDTRDSHQPTARAGSGEQPGVEGQETVRTNETDTPPTDNQPQRQDGGH